ncbi:MAG: hypothetical protein R3F16_10185 [Myxococcota bacterium]
MRVLFVGGLLLSILLTGLSTGARAQTGQLEINQTVVEEAGGFPYLITSPGAYRLTGDLVVDGDVPAIVLAANEVHLDLNGHAIRGPSSCSVFDCPTGQAAGVAWTLGGGAASSVENGRVVGFSGDCIRLFSFSRVADVSIRSCGASGIALAASSQAIANRVDSVGEHGLLLGSGSLYAHNVVGSTGLAEAEARAVVGGSASAGNVCLDGSCSRRGERRFYLTRNLFPGGDALGACTPGFHMASIWEVLDPTDLAYDHLLGQTAGDSGEGPPSFSTTATLGWIRTGFEAQGFGDEGEANCSAWTNSQEALGTVAGLHQSWQTGPTDAFGTPVEPKLGAWLSGATFCSIPKPVWCVED